MNYTKQQIIDMLKSHCIHDDQFGMEYNEETEKYEANLKGITMQILNDEDDYDMLCDLLGIPKEER